MILRKTLIIGFITILIASGVFIMMYRHSPQLQGGSDTLFIPRKCSPYEWLPSSALNSLDKKLTFLICKFRRIKQLHAGRYKLKEGESIWTLITRMRSGEQDPLRVKLDNIETLEDLCGIMGRSVRDDSIDFIHYFQSDSTTDLYHTKVECIPCLIAPDEYEFYWTISPQEFLRRMNMIRAEFWNPERDRLAASLQLSRDEVCVLASIVRAETGKRDEAPIIAGLYMNRLKRGIPLQSDPTAIFRREDEKQRVLNSDIENPHDYNTYVITGLPPGPICFVEDFYMLSVLEHAQHNYIYMCAEPGLTGRHSFTASYSEHLNNASRYHKWLDSRGL